MQWITVAVRPKGAAIPSRENLLELMALKDFLCSGTKIRRRNWSNSLSNKYTLNAMEQVETPYAR